MNRITHIQSISNENQMFKHHSSINMIHHDQILQLPCVGSGKSSRARGDFHVDRWIFGSCGIDLRMGGGWRACHCCGDGLFWDLDWEYLKANVGGGRVYRCMLGGK